MSTASWMLDRSNSLPSAVSSAPFRPVFPLSLLWRILSEDFGARILCGVWQGKGNERKSLSQEPAKIDGAQTRRLCATSVHADAGMGLGNGIGILKDSFQSLQRLCNHSRDGHVGKMVGLCLPCHLAKSVISDQRPLSTRDLTGCEEHTMH